MKIGRYNIVVRKANLRLFIVLYAFFITATLLMGNNMQPSQVVLFALVQAFAGFVIVVAFENYYRNNLDKKKNNWLWSGYDETMSEDK